MLSSYEYRYYSKQILSYTCNVNNLLFTFQGIDSNSASFLLSIIGITNTIGRVVCGYVADFPWVDALLLNNICLVVSTLAVASTPFCSSYAGYIVMSIFFGIAICEYFLKV
jgi:predicted MFS family arabinose efflux permease